MCRAAYFNVRFTITCRPMPSTLILFYYLFSMTLFCAGRCQKVGIVRRNRRRFRTVPIHYVTHAGTFMLDNVIDIIPATASATDGNRNHNDGAPNRYCFFFCNLSNIYWIFIAYKRHQRLKEEAGTRDAYASWARGTFFIFILFDHSQINTRPLVRPPLPHPS